jgi:hypothetical protein
MAKKVAVKKRPALNKKRFTECASEAKKIVALIRLQNKHRMKVAELALKACTIVHGGKNIYERFTVKKFGERIGVNHRTIHEWIRIYRMVYSKLDQERKEDYNRLGSARVRYVMKGLSGKEQPKTIQNKFDKAYKQGGEIDKIDKYLRNLGTLIYNVSNSSRMISLDDKLLYQILEKSNTIAGYVKLELKHRDLGVSQKYIKPKLDLDNFWVNEVGVQ